MMTLARDIGNAWVMGSWENEFLSWINLNMHGSSFFNYLFYEKDARRIYMKFLIKILTIMNMLVLI